MSTATTSLTAASSEVINNQEQYEVRYSLTTVKKAALIDTFAGIGVYSSTRGKSKPAPASEHCVIRNW